MTRRQLGKSGLEIGPLALGTNVFGWTVDEPTAFTILDAFVDAGMNLIDTADSYSHWIPGNQGGESETIIGNWLRATGNRDRVLIATKVGSEMGPDRKGLSKMHIVRSVEESLRRLRTDRIDLYQSHRDDPATPLEETLGAYDELVKQGKVRLIGASNFAAKRFDEAITFSALQGLPQYQSLQPRYNLYDRAAFEEELELVCRDKGIGVITYYSLASGFLSGKYRSREDLLKSVRGHGAKMYMNARGFRILAALDSVAERHHTKPASVALAWLMSRPTITAPISSATNLEQLRDLVAATDLTLDDDSLGLLNAASAERGAGKTSKKAV